MKQIPTHPHAPTKVTEAAANQIPIIDMVNGLVRVPDTEIYSENSGRGPSDQQSPELDSQFDLANLLFSGMEFCLHIPSWANYRYLSALKTTPIDASSLLL